MRIRGFVIAGLFLLLVAGGIAAIAVSIAHVFYAGGYQAAVDDGAAAPIGMSSTRSVAPQAGLSPNATSPKTVAEPRTGDWINGTRIRARLVSAAPAAMDNGSAGTNLTFELEYQDNATRWAEVHWTWDNTMWSTWNDDRATLTITTRYAAHAGDTVTLTIRAYEGAGVIQDTLTWTP